MGINCMSLAVWLVEDRKCSAVVVGLDLVLGLSMVRRCSLKRSFKRRFSADFRLKIFLCLVLDCSVCNIGLQAMKPDTTHNWQKCY